MKYPVKISKDELSSTWRLVVPDLPGCEVVGDSVNNVLTKVNDVIANHLKILSEYGESIPHAKKIDELMNERNIDGIIWAIIEFDIVPFLGKSHKINVTLPELLIKQIDTHVSKSESHKTRSGFIAASCIAQLSK